MGFILYIIVLYEHQALYNWGLILFPMTKIIWYSQGVTTS